MLNHTSAPQTIIQKQYIYEKVANPDRNKEILSYFQKYHQFTYKEGNKGSYTNSYVLCLFPHSDKNEQLSEDSDQNSEQTEKDVQYKFLTYNKNTLTNLKNHIRDTHIEQLVDVVEKQKYTALKNKQIEDRKKMVVKNQKSKTKNTQNVVQFAKNQVKKDEDELYEQYKFIFFKFTMMIIQGMQPVFMCEKQGWIDFFNAGFPKFNPFSRQKTNRAILQIEELGIQQVRDLFIKEDLKNRTYCLNFDHTIPLSGFQYIVILLSYISLNFEKQQFVFLKMFEVQGETSKDIQNDLMSTLSFYDLELQFDVPNVPEPEEQIILRNENNDGDLFNPNDEDYRDYEEDSDFEENKQIMLSSESQSDEDLEIVIDESVQENQDENQKVILPEEKVIEISEISQNEKFNFEKELKELISKNNQEYINPLKNVTCCADGASANIKALQSSKTISVSLVCFNHVLHNSIIKAVQRNSPLCELIQKINSIAVHFKRSSKDKKLLKNEIERLNKVRTEKDKIKNKTLKRLQKTRWCCIPDMLNSFLNSFPAIQNFFNKSFPVIQKNFINNDQISDLKEHTEIFDELKSIQKFFEYQQPRCQYILDSYNNLQQYLKNYENNCQMLQDFKQYLLEELSDRMEKFYFQDENIHLSLRIASYLDPETSETLQMYDPEGYDLAVQKITFECIQMNLYQNFIEDQSKLKNKMQEEDTVKPKLLTNHKKNKLIGNKKQKLNSDQNKEQKSIQKNDNETNIKLLQSNIESQIYNYKRICQKFDELVDEGQPPYNLKRDPDYDLVEVLDFWKNQLQANAFINLRCIASKYLTILASGAPSERCFSDLGYLISKRRTKLKPKTVNSMLFTKNNLQYKSIDYLSIQKEFQKLQLRKWEKKELNNG